MGGWWYVGHWRLPERYKALHLKSEDADGLPSKFRRKVVPRIWYFMVNSGAVFFLPFLGIYWRTELNYSTREIGLIQALRPWISALSGNIFTQVADIWDIHQLMLVLTYSITIISRGLVTIWWSFGIMLFLTLMMEVGVSPMSVLVDSTVAAGSTKDGAYGRARLWASVGWGIFAPVAGAILTKYGLHTSFMIFAAIYSSAAIPTLLMPAGLLSSKYQNQRIGSNPKRKDPPPSSSNDISIASKNEEKVSGAGGHETMTVVAMEPAPAAPAPSNTGAGLTSGTLSRRTSRVSRNHSDSHAVSVEVDARGRPSEQHNVVVIAMPPPTGDADANLPQLPQSTPPQPQLPQSSVVAVVQVQSDAAKTDQSVDRSVAGSDTATTISDSDTGSSSETKESTWAALRRLLSDVYVMTFLFLAFLMGVGNGFIGYLFLLLNDYGASGTLLGLCLTMNCIGEVPFFYFSGAIIKRLGVQTALNIAMGAYCLRVGCYALIPEYPTLWIILPVELLQGVTFAMAYSAGTSIFSGLYTGFGAGVGGLVGGMLYDAYGGQIMYIAATGALAVGWAGVNFTNLVHGMRRGMKGGVKRVKRVSTYLGAQVREGIHRVSPSWESQKGVQKGGVGGANGVAQQEKTRSNHV